MAGIKIIFGIICIIGAAGTLFSNEIPTDRMEATGYYAGAILFALIGIWLTRSGLKSRKK